MRKILKTAKDLGIKINMYNGRYNVDIEDRLGLYIYLRKGTMYRAIYYTEEQITGNRIYKTEADILEVLKQFHDDHLKTLKHE